MKSISDLNILIRADIPSCPDFVIERQSIRVARDFCSKTHVWKETFTETLATGSDTLVLAPSAGEIDTIRSLTPAFQEWEFFPPDTIQFQAEAGSDVEVSVEAALVPGLDDTEIPGWIMDRYERALVDGTYARLMMQDNQAWTSPNLAMVYKQRYDREVGRARIDKLRGFSIKQFSVNRRRFA